MDAPRVDQPVLAQVEGRAGGLPVPVRGGASGGPERRDGDGEVASHDSDSSVSRGDRRLDRAGKEQNIIINARTVQGRRISPPTAIVAGARLLRPTETGGKLTP